MEIVDVWKKVMSERGLPAGAADDTLTSLGIDSLNLVELLIALEEALGTRFDMNALDPSQFNTVHDLWHLMKDTEGDK